MTKNGLLI